MIKTNIVDIFRNMTIENRSRCYIKLRNGTKLIKLMYIDSIFNGEFINIFIYDENYHPDLGEKNYRLVNRIWVDGKVDSLVNTINKYTNDKIKVIGEPNILNGNIRQLFLYNLL